MISVVVMVDNMGIFAVLVVTFTSFIVLVVCVV